MKITKHAELRMKQRCGFNKKSMKRMAKKAFEDGMTFNETKGQLKKWVTEQYLYNCTANNIRLYGDKAYIFHNSILITVLQIPHELAKFVSTKSNKTVEIVNTNLQPTILMA